GDPASDYLVARQVFLSSQSTSPSASQRKLLSVVAAANRAGFAIRVAIISTDYDLGSITALWRKPRLYVGHRGGSSRDTASVHLARGPAAGARVRAARPTGPSRLTCHLPRTARDRDVRRPAVPQSLPARGACAQCCRRPAASVAATRDPGGQRGCLRQRRRARQPPARRPQVG